MRDRISARIRVLVFRLSKDVICTIMWSFLFGNSTFAGIGHRKAPAEPLNVRNERFYRNSHRMGIAMTAMQCRAASLACLSKLRAE